MSDTDSTDDSPPFELEESPLADPNIVAGLLDTLVILWTTNAHKLVLQQNFKFLEALRTRISRTMPLFLKVFKVRIGFV